jgi:NO-binding membrane sensor protein with MHYT domain
MNATNQMRARVWKFEAEVAMGIGLRAGHFVHPLCQLDQ